MTPRSQVESVVSDIIEHHGEIDILLIGAGALIKYPVVELSENIWDRVVIVSLLGTFLRTRAMGHGMLARGYSGSFISRPVM